MFSTKSLLHMVRRTLKRFVKYPFLVITTYDNQSMKFISIELILHSVQSLDILIHQLHSR